MNKKIAISLAVLILAPVSLALAEAPQMTATQYQAIQSCKSKCNDDAVAAGEALPEAERGLGAPDSKQHQIDVKALQCYADCDAITAAQIDKSATPHSAEDLVAYSVKRGGGQNCPQAAGLKFLKGPYASSKLFSVELYEGDIVTPIAGGNVTVSIGRSSSIVHDGASLKIQCPTPTGSTFVETIKGIVNFILPHAEQEAPVKFQASSHTIVAAIKGTQFMIDATDPNNESLYVFDGTVDTSSATHPDQPHAAVSAGNAISATEASLGAVHTVTAAEFMAKYPGVSDVSAPANADISALKVDEATVPAEDSNSSGSKYILVLGVLAVLAVIYFFLKK